MKKSTKITTVIIVTIGLITAGSAYAAKNKFRDKSMHADFAVMFVTNKLMRLSKLKPVFRMLSSRSSLTQFQLRPKSDYC